MLYNFLKKIIMKKISSLFSQVYKYLKLSIRNVPLFKLIFSREGKKMFFGRFLQNKKNIFKAIKYL